MMSHSYFEQKTKITRETFSEINFILKFLVCEIREENRILVMWWLWLFLAVNGEKLRFKNGKFLYGVSL